MPIQNHLSQDFPSLLKNMLFPKQCVIWASAWRKRVRRLIHSSSFCSRCRIFIFIQIQNMNGRPIAIANTFTYLEHSPFLFYYLPAQILLTCQRQVPSNVQGKWGYAKCWAQDENN